MANEQTENLTVAADGTVTLVLPSGKTAIMKPYKGKQIRQAQKAAGGDETKLVYAIIALTTEIEGKPIVMEDLDEMSGPDVLKLMGQFGNFQ